MFVDKDFVKKLNNHISEFEKNQKAKKFLFEKQLREALELELESDYNKDIELKDIHSFNAKGVIEAIGNRIKHNDILSDFYNQLYEEYGFECYNRKSIAIKDCCNFFINDYYVGNGCKDIKSVNRCRDKFCPCCGNAIARLRECKFTPVLDEFISNNYDVYHSVLTVPNCKGSELVSVVDRMFEAFSQLYRFFRSNAPVKGYDFTRYGLVGAVRAIEITKNHFENTFHPHFHCLFVCNGGLKLDRINKNHVNSFSFNNVDVKRSHKKKDGESIRFYSDFEILLQKLWRLKYDGVKVNKANLESLNEGYSCTFDNARGKYHEVFKYCTKGIFKNDDGLPSYVDFKNLQEALNKRHVIQGYGVLRVINKFDDSLEFKVDCDYLGLIKKLQECESPIGEFQKLADVKWTLKNENIIYFSRSSLRNAYIEDKKGK